MLQQIGADTGWVDVGLVHFVNGNDDGHTSGFRVVDQFNGLRHHAVISRDNQNGNVSGFRTTGTHRRKGFMARRIDEGDQTTIGLHLVSTNMLGNAARFA